MILEWGRILVHWGQDTLRWKYLQLKYTISKILISISIFIALLWVALFVYGSFYYMYMPSVSHERECNFLFDVCEDGVGVCSFPTARISLTDENNQLVLSPGQAYKIILDLEVPESGANQQAGMFVVFARFYNTSGSPVQSASKTTMLRYRSSLLHTMSTLFYSPFLITGANEQKQVLHVELFSKYIEDPYNPAVDAQLQLRARSIQLYSASLKIYAHFTGLRYLMFNWPMTCSIVGTGLVLTFLMFCALLGWYNYFHSGYVVQPSSHRLLLEERRRQIQARLVREGRTESNHSATTEEGPEGGISQYPNSGTSGFDHSSAESIGSAVSTLSIHSVSSSPQQPCNEDDSRAPPPTQQHLSDESLTYQSSTDSPETGTRTSNEGNLELRQRHMTTPPRTQS